MKISILNSIGQKFAGSTTCSFDWSIEIAKISTRELECTRCLPYLYESDSHFIFTWKTFHRNLQCPYSITRYEIVIRVPPPAFDLALSQFKMVMITMSVILMQYFKIVMLHFSGIFMLYADIYALFVYFMMADRQTGVASRRSHCVCVIL